MLGWEKMLLGFIAMFVGVSICPLVMDYSGKPEPWATILNATSALLCGFGFVTFFLNAFGGDKTKWS